MYHPEPRLAKGRGAALRPCWHRHKASNPSRCSGAWRGRQPEHSRLIDADSEAGRAAPRGRAEARAGPAQPVSELTHRAARACDGRAVRRPDDGGGPADPRACAPRGPRGLARLRCARWCSPMRLVALGGPGRSLAAAMPLTRLLESQLYDIAPHDAATLDGGLLGLLSSRSMRLANGQLLFSATDLSGPQPPSRLQSRHEPSPGRRPCSRNWPCGPTYL